MTAQNLIALARANEVRVARCAILRQLGAGELTAAEILADVPAECDRMPLGDLLRSQRRWGWVRADRICRRLHIYPNRTLGALTDRQRAELIASLGGR